MKRLIRKQSWLWGFLLGLLFSIANFSAASDEQDPLDAELQKHLQEQAGEDLGQSSSEPPLQRVANRMREAVGLMKRGDSQEEARRVQEDIVKILDQMLQQQSRKQSKPSQSGSNSNTSKQSSRSQDKNQAKPVSQSTAGSPQESASDVDSSTQTTGGSSAQSYLQQLWGHLPQRARQDISQEWGEEFLPKYELQLEAYFRRLAEESARDMP